MPFQISLEGSLDVISNLNKKNNNFPPEREYLGWKRSGWPPLAWIPRRVVHLRVKVLGGTPSPPSFSSSLSLSFPLFRSFCPPPFYFFSSSTRKRVYILRACACAPSFFFFPFLLKSPVGRIRQTRFIIFLDLSLSISIYF